MKVRVKICQPKQKAADLTSRDFEFSDLIRAIEVGKTFVIDAMCDDLHRKENCYPYSEGHEKHVGRMEVWATDRKRGEL